jgi:hypothetical protein
VVRIGSWCVAARAWRGSPLSGASSAIPSRSAAPEGPFWQGLARRLVGLSAGAVGALAIAGLAGCANSLPTAEAVARTAPVPQASLETLLQQAREASAQAQPDKARRLYRDAAKAYPTAKEPWLQLAEDYFRRADYGNAILAAQEVTQRDASHPMAQSVLAVSGLRVSAQALGELRERTTFEVGSRDEAVQLARQLRAYLGEPVLVAPASAAAGSTDSGTPGRQGSTSGVAKAAEPSRTSSVRKTSATRSTARKAVVTRAASPPATPIAKTVAAPTSSSAAPANPFKVLD